MSTADWKRTFKEPEDYGPYLVKVKGEKKASIAYFDHPIGHRETGWYEKVGDDEFVLVDVVYWDHLPE